MLTTKRLNQLGQSLWLDDITRDLLDSGTLARYIAEWSVTGLTSNPTIFDHAITHSASYDSEIARLLGDRPPRRGAVLRARDPGSVARRRSVPADPPAHGDGGRLGVARGLAAAGA